MLLHFIYTQKKAVCAGGTPLNGHVSAADRRLYNQADGGIVAALLAVLKCNTGRLLQLGFPQILLSNPSPISHLVFRSFNCIMMKSAAAKAVQIGPILATDFPSWSKLFHAYVDFYKSSLPDEQYKSTFARLTDPKTDLSGLALREEGPDGKLIGIMHFFPHQTPWSEKQIMHINGMSTKVVAVGIGSPFLSPQLSLADFFGHVDLFVDPEYRGNGYGRRLIQEAGRIAKEQGCLRVQWATQHGNPARKLYDELGVCNFVEYRMAI